MGSSGSRAESFRACTGSQTTWGRCISRRSVVGYVKMSQNARFKVDFTEVHDCFTINQLLSTEALGLCGDGQAGWAYREGRFGPDDRCPVNLSGGLKAKGHPVGATDCYMHALAFKQLAGEPIGMAPAGMEPQVGVVFNIGGSAATNCVTVLRRKS